MYLQFDVQEELIYLANTTFSEDFRGNIGIF